MYVTLRGTPTLSDGTDASAGPRRAVPGAVLGFGMVSLLTDISSESVAAILPLYITAVLGMGPLAYGFLDGIYQGVSAAVRILGGWWSDATNRPKWVAFLGYLVSALSRVGLLFATGFTALSAVIAVDRLGKGLRTGPRDSLIATASDPADLGRNFGVHRALDTTGALLGPLLAFAVLAAVPIGLGGYRAVFGFSLAFGILGVLVLALAVPDLRVERAAGPVRERHRPTFQLSDLALPGLRRVLVVAGLLGLVTVGDGFIYLSLAEGGSLTATYFPLLFVGTSLAYLVLAIPMGRLADRLGRARVFVTGHVVLLGVYALTASSGGGSLWTAVVVLLLLGTFYAATDGVLAALVTQSVPEAARARGIAAAQTVVALARFASSVGFGLLWQLAGRETALWVMVPALMVGLAAAAVILRPLLGSGPGGRA